MPTTHVTVHNDKVVAKICDWAAERGIEYYVAPNPTDARAIADHITLEIPTLQQCSELAGFITANRWKTEVVVE